MRRWLAAIFCGLVLSGCNVLAALQLVPVIHCSANDDCNDLASEPRSCVNGICQTGVLIPECTLLNACDIEGDCCSAVGIGTVICEDGLYEEGDVEDCNGFVGDAGVFRDAGTDGGIEDAAGGTDAGADAGDAGSGDDSGVADGGVDGGGLDGGGDAGSLTGCEELDIGGRAVFHCPDPLPFSEARTNCVQAGLDLVTVADLETYQGFLEFIPAAPTWVGLLRPMGVGYGWLDGTPLSFVMWNPGEPANVGPAGCGAYQPTGLGFAERPCMDALPYVCAAPGAVVQTTGMYEPFTIAPADCTDAVAAGGRVYRWCADSLEYLFASNACDAMNMQLVEPRFPPEATFIDENYSTFNDVFIGLVENINMPDMFLWQSDGSALGDFQPWAAGEPLSGSQNCVVQALNIVEWRVDECDGPEDYMCETRFAAD